MGGSGGWGFSMLEVHVQPLASLRASSALCAQWKVSYSTGPLHTPGKCSMTEATPPGPHPVVSWTSFIKKSCPFLIIHSFIQLFITNTTESWILWRQSLFLLFKCYQPQLLKSFSENYKLSVWPIPETAYGPSSSQCNLHRAWRQVRRKRSEWWKADYQQLRSTPLKATLLIS